MVIVGVGDAENYHGRILIGETAEAVNLIFLMGSRPEKKTANSCF
jgi:hypothetical protein